MSTVGAIAIPYCVRKYCVTRTEIRIVALANDLESVRTQDHRQVEVMLLADAGAQAKFCDGGIPQPTLADSKLEKIGRKARAGQHGERKGRNNKP